MLTEFFVLLLTATSLSGTEGVIVAEYEGPELSALEESCQGTLQQCVLGGTSSRVRAGRGRPN